MKPWKIVLIIWVFLWIFFLIRGFTKGEFKEFITLYKLDMDGKHAYILGNKLNSFLNLCKNTIPPSSTYEIAGDLDEHNRYRFIYSLYPRQQSDRADYVLKIYTKNSQYILERQR